MFAKLQSDFQLHHVCLLMCTEQLSSHSMKFDIWLFFKNLSRKVKFH